jgi:pimeloyl-ACP methyl ester carboxylesterase
MTRGRTRSAVSLVLAVLAASCIVGMPAQAGAAAPGCMPGIGRRVPIVFVHGFLGQPTAWTQMQKIIQKQVPQAQTVLFDYSRYNRDWVDNPNIGPKLASEIACLAASSRQAGGSGKVIVVAHSMGGLATRWAATESSDASEVAKDLGLVVTISTPNLGTGLATEAAALLEAICMPSTLDGPAPTPAPGSFCATWSAVYGMQRYAPEIEKLSWLPNGIPVFALGGDVTLTVPLFGTTLRLDTKGDLAVGDRSAIQGIAHANEGGGSAAISCSSNVVHDLLTRSGPPCWHSALPHNPTVEQDAIDAIRRYLSQPSCSAAALSPTDLASYESFRMLRYSCFGGYALAVGQLSFAGSGASPPETGVGTFRANGSRWKVMTWDDGVCLLGTPAVCCGLARPAGSVPPIPTACLRLRGWYSRRSPSSCATACGECFLDRVLALLAAVVSKDGLAREPASRCRTRPGGRPTLLPDGFSNPRRNDRTVALTATARAARTCGSSGCRIALRQVSHQTGARTVEDPGLGSSGVSRSPDRQGWNGRDHAREQRVNPEAQG